MNTAACEHSVLRDRCLIAVDELLETEDPAARWEAADAAREALAAIGRRVSREERALRALCNAVLALKPDERATGQARANIQRAESNMFAAMPVQWLRESVGESLRTEGFPPRDGQHVGI